MSLGLCFESKMRDFSLGNRQKDTVGEVTIFKVTQYILRNTEICKIKVWMFSSSAERALFFIEQKTGDVFCRLSWT